MVVFCTICLRAYTFVTQYPTIRPLRLFALIHGGISLRQSLYYQYAVKVLAIGQKSYLASASSTTIYYYIGFIRQEILLRAFLRFQYNWQITTPFLHIINTFKECSYNKYGFLSHIFVFLFFWPIFSLIVWQIYLYRRLYFNWVAVLTS